MSRNNKQEHKAEKIRATILKSTSWLTEKYLPMNHHKQLRPRTQAEPKKQTAISSLFVQLSLPCDELSIHRFSKTHQLPKHTMLAEAQFWNEEQKDFIKEALWMDSAWAKALKELDDLLRNDV